MFEEIEIPESNDPEWQIQILREISNSLHGIAEQEEISDSAYDKIQLVLAYVEALQEYSGV